MYRLGGIKLHDVWLVSFALEGGILFENKEDCTLQTKVLYINTDSTPAMLTIILSRADSIIPLYVHHLSRQSIDYFDPDELSELKAELVWFSEI